MVRGERVNSELSMVNRDKVKGRKRVRTGLGTLA
jgi:hypothetical protein